MRNFKFQDCEVYKLPRGRIFIGPSSEVVSFGFLELNSQQKLDKHNRPVDEELIQALAESGCKRLFFGIESGDNQILKNMKKLHTLK